MSEKSIPSIIHYCWFGGNPLPELAQKCIASWKKYCPDYEIIEWSENNFDVSCCNYVREAYEAKMWAFVSDYARFKILYEYGGVYFDTDVELIKPIDDIIKKGPYMGLEECRKEGEISASDLAVNAGLGLAVNAGNGLVKEILESYHCSNFIQNENGGYETVVTRVTNIILKHGDIVPGQISRVSGINIYPPEYFCPLNCITGKISIRENTRSIHHYMASWLNWRERIIQKIDKYFFQGGKILRAVGYIFYLPIRIIDLISKKGIKQFIFIIMKKVKARKSGWGGY